MLVTYHGVVHKGKVEIKLDQVPDGTPVVLVVPQTLPSIEEQKKRLRHIPQEEWEGRFDEYDRLLVENHTEEDVDAISDEEIVALVHEVREEYRTRQ